MTLTEIRNAVISRMAAQTAIASDAVPMARYLTPVTAISGPD